jgi:hypothetical protein
MENIKNELFGKSEIIGSEKMKSIQGGYAYAVTKTKGSKTKETGQDKDSNASGENRRI